MLVPEAWRSPTSYDDAARIEALGSHEYVGNIHSDYSHGITAHGGFIQSLILSAVRQHFATTLAAYNQFNTLSLHTEFIRPAFVGEIRIAIRDTRLSKASSIVHITAIQNDKDCVVGYVTNINHAKSRGISIPRYHKPLPAPPPIDFGKVEANNDDPNWIAYTIPYREDAPSRALCNATFVIQRRPESDRSISQHWLACARPEEAWTTSKLGLVIDQFVPAIENFFDSPHNAASAARIAPRWALHGAPLPPSPPHTWSVPRWYATANMSLEIKQPLPDKGTKWLFCRYKTAETSNGRFDVHVEIWDQDLNLVAISQQLWYLIDLSQSPEWQAASSAREEKESRAVSSKL